MGNMKELILRVFVLLLFISTNIADLKAQSGDQILDGIGETDLNARYVFEEGLRDWSRNGLHGQSGGEELRFIEDKKFKKVLSLSGKDKSYVTFPRLAVEGSGSLSLSGWFFFRSGQSNQFLLDFGTDKNNRFWIAPFGTGKNKDFLIALKSRKQGKEEVASLSTEINEWIHLTFVLDAASKAILVYKNGNLAYTVKDVVFDMDEFFGQKTEASLILGKSDFVKNSSLQANLHDFRIYNVALTESQIKRIFRNATRGLNEGFVNTQKGVVDELPRFSESNFQSYNKYLLEVEDVEVETLVGELPRLPRYLKGKYKEGIDGPPVRVSWSMPVENKITSEAGTYSIVGSVHGTDFKPTAVITVKEAN